MLKVLLSAVILFLPLCGYASDRCQQYIPEVRKANFYYWGINFPYHYAVGQLKQESVCRADATAFDGGQGLAQFMPATEKYVESLMKENLNLYNTHDAIRAQAFYMKLLHKQNWVGRLWLTYMFYNSGVGTVKKEFQRAEIADWDLMRMECRRKILTLKNGQKLDLCDVGYDYPKKVYKYGKQYSIIQDTIKFW